VKSLGVRSALLVPLPDGEHHVGILLVNAVSPGAFSEQDLQVLQLLAGQVGAVMSRAAAFEAQKRLLSERSERTRVLEREIARRTAELQTSNRELEAFAYSVSHDLRAPLRAIDGFSKVLVDRYGDELDDSARGYLQRVRAASQKMSSLIDDLLQISRVTRQEMRICSVDLSALARSIATELSESEPERSVEWAIVDNLTARGDAALLRVALENLLGNAWKFTSKNERARIEFDATQEDATTVFYVRDDGAGFDMTYAGKMFGAFQRLHTTSEFEGTGIGLATVERIVHRHGGRIHAEGRPGQGATFQFTLEPECP
jgi:light-regulated signal transduction histidine kinase (bacteriophytochrome)